MDFSIDESLFGSNDYESVEENKKIGKIFKEYYRKLLITIEVVHKNKLLPIHFPKMAFGKFMKDEHLLYVEKNLDRTNAETRIESLIEMGPRLELEMRSSYCFYEKLKIPFQKLIYYNQLKFRYATSILVL